MFASPVYRLKHERGESQMIMYAVQALMQDPCNPSGECASYDWQGLRPGWVNVSASLVFIIDTSLPLQIFVEPPLLLPGYVPVERILICLLGPISAMTTGPPEKPEKWFLPSEGISLALSEAERIIGSEARIWSGRNKGINGHWVRPHKLVSEESRELKELRAQSMQVLQTAVKRKRRSEEERKAADDDLYQSTSDQRPPKIKSVTWRVRSPSRPEQEHTESKSNQGPAVDSIDSKMLMSETKLNKLDVERKDLSPLEALAESCGWQIDAEKFLWDDSEVPVNTVIKKRYLGKGSIGDVAEVNVEGYEMSMVRKRIEIGRARRNARIRKRMIEAEVKNMKSLDHEHIVKILGCYQEQRDQIPTTCVLMSPVGENDLEYFLGEVFSRTKTADRGLYVSWIRSWFPCLASALAYMHTMAIHHEDIKPKNIIHRRGTVYFTDFSSSRKLRSSEETSTDSPGTVTRQFAAPETLRESGQKHGSKSDVFSLGLVFVEMTVAWNKSISQLRRFVFDGQAEQYHQHLERLPLWFAEKSSSRGLSLWEACIKRMLAYERDARPSPQEVVDLLAQDRLRGIVKHGCICQKPSSHDSDGPAIEEPKSRVPQRSSPKLADDAAVATGQKPTEDMIRITKTSTPGAKDGTAKERPPRNSVTQTGNTAKPNVRSHHKVVPPKKVPQASRDINQPEMSGPGEPSNARSEHTPAHEAENNNLDRLKDGFRTKRKAVEPSNLAVVENRKASKILDENDPKPRGDLARSPQASPGLHAILTESARTSTENKLGADSTKQSRPQIHVRERSARRTDTNGLGKATPADDIDEIVEIIVESDRGYSSSPQPHNHRSRKKRSTSLYSTETLNAGSSSSLPLARRHSRSEYQKDSSPSRLSQIMSWGGGLSPYPRL